MTPNIQCTKVIIISNLPLFICFGNTRLPESTAIPKIATDLGPDSRVEVMGRTEGTLCDRGRGKKDET